MEVFFPHIYSFLEVSGAFKNLVVGMLSHKLFSTLQTQKKEKKIKRKSSKRIESLYNFDMSSIVILDVPMLVM